MLKVRPRPKVKKMGVIHVPVTIRETRKSRKAYTANFLVDTGATDCFVPARELRRIGIEPAGWVECEMADGARVEYGFSVAVIEFMGTFTAGRVIFGPDDCEPLLGVTAMESVGVVIDPQNERLKRLPSIRLK